MIGKELEVESVYSVEEATALPIVDSPRTKSTPRECEVVQITGKEEVSIQDGDQTVLESQKESFNAAAKQQTEREGNMKLESRQSEMDAMVVSNINKKLPDAKNLKSSDLGESIGNRGNSGRVTPRGLTKTPSVTPRGLNKTPSVTPRGLTKTPSDDLRRLVKTEVKGLHKYSDGLEKFFRAGLGEEEEDITPREESKDMLSSIEMKECTYQGKSNLFSSSLPQLSLVSGVYYSVC